MPRRPSEPDAGLRIQEILQARGEAQPAQAPHARGVPPAERSAGRRRRGLPAGVVIERGRRLADGARRGCDGADPHRQGGRKTARGGFLRRRSKVRRRAAFRETGRGGGA